MGVDAAVANAAHGIADIALRGVLAIVSTLAIEELIGHAQNSGFRTHTDVSN